MQQWQEQEGNQHTIHGQHARGHTTFLFSTICLSCHKKKLRWN